MIAKKQYGLSDVVAVAKRRCWLILLPCGLAALGTAIATTYLPDRYRADTLILVVPQRVPESYVRSTVTTRIEDRLQSISQQILSRTRLERIIDDLNLYPKERHSAIMEDLVEKMRRNIDVEIVKGDAFRVSFIGDEPRTVMKVTERLASLFIEENLRDREVLAEGSYEFLDSQLEESRRKLVEHEKKLEDYRRRYAGQLPNQVDANLQVIQNTQLQIQALNESMARDRDRRLAVERAIADGEAAEASGTPPPATADAPAAPGSAAQQLQQAEEELRRAELRLTPEHPDILRMHRAIELLKQKAADEAVARAADESTPGENPAVVARRNRKKELQEEMTALDAQLTKKDDQEKQLRDVIATYQARVEAMPARESDLIELTRDYDTLQKLYANLLSKKEDSKIAANLERRQIGEQFKVLDPARVPERPFSPDRPRLNLLGALAGLAFGIGLTVLLDLADSTLKTDDDVMVALSLPVLSLVPRIVTTREQRRARRDRALASVACVFVFIIGAAWLALRLRA